MQEQSHTLCPYARSGREHKRLPDGSETIHLTEPNNFQIITISLEIDDEGSSEVKLAVYVPLGTHSARH
jgi:hypothetical protein